MLSRRLCNRMMRLFCYMALLFAGPAVSAQQDDELVRRLGVERGIVVLAGVRKPGLALQLARGTERTVYVQLADAGEVASLRRAADEAGVLGPRFVVERGPDSKLFLADNLADAVLLGDPAGKEEALRVLRPGGKGILGAEEFTKPFPAGADEWTHPYHGPDNNPQSKDRLARRPYLTQFMAEPWYASMPQMSVISGGRIFKVFGNRTSAQPQWQVVNTLMALNAWNGTLLWRRPVPPNFMFHRSTLIATPDLVYLGDDASCKRIDAATGATRDEITVPAELTDGSVWKWMALEGGVLYALVGEKEGRLEEVKGDRFRGAGWPWWKIENYPFGFGRTVVAMDPESKKVLWHHREESPLDPRAVCMAAGRLFLYSHKKFLAALDVKTGKVLWRTSDEKVLAAIGEHDAAQHWMKGFSSTAYAKCSDKAVYFAGPTRKSIAAVSAEDGKLLWEMAGGNSQLVLREDGLYALGEASRNNVQSSVKVNPMTGDVLARFAGRDRCTRATGSIDCIFTRGGGGGSTSVFDVTSATPRMGLVPPMRPACQDGVLVANGQLYWGPWMCACDGTQVGVICLASGGGFDYGAEAKESERLEFTPGDVRRRPMAEGDWPAFRKDNARSIRSESAVPAEVALRWELRAALPTAPIAAAGRVFVAGADGAVKAADAATGKVQWVAYTGGAMRYPPAFAADRLYAGSGDGWVYCWEAETGRQLWRFRAAPVERRVPIFGSLLSTWPVGSGVLVESGVVYAAAGINDYDGTHVYALDAQYGKILWQNHTSGHLYDERKDSGAAVQGPLLLHEGGLYMAGGCLAKLARYDVKDGRFEIAGGGGGKDLFVAGGAVRSSGLGLYIREDDAHYVTHAVFPSGDKYVAVLTDAVGVTSGVPDFGNRKRPEFVWSARPFQEVAAVAIAKDAIVVAGVDRAGKGTDVTTTSGVAAISLADGKVLWKQALPSPPVGWGVAIDREGRVLVSLRDGRVVCFWRG